MKVWKKIRLVTILLTLGGVLFLVPAVKQVIKGQPLSWSPALATAIGLLLATVISLVVRRKSGGSSGPPSA